MFHNIIRIIHSYSIVKQNIYTFGCHHTRLIDTVRGCMMMMMLMTMMTMRTFADNEVVATVDDVAAGGRK